MKSTGVVGNSFSEAWRRKFRVWRSSQKKRLVMTLIVRNEVDVIEGNIRFHLDHGVDFIVVTDNGSTDGTRAILERYREQGVLHLITEDSRIFEHEKWVNRMGRIAHETYQADAIFHADADELWFPHSGSLKREILSRHSADVLYVPVRNLLLRDRQGAENFPVDVAYMVKKPMKKSLKQVMQEADHQSLLLFRHPPKVLYKTAKGYLEVVQGNHRIQSGGSHIGHQPARNIEILHFPIRSREQFLKKVANNGEGIANLEKVQASPEDRAWHVKRWYRLQQEGGLDAEYRRLVLTESDVKRYRKSGQVGVIGSRYQGVLRYYA